MRRHEINLKRRLSTAVNGFIGLVINYALPVAGLMPLALQHYMRDQIPLFRQLDPRSAVSASAIYLLAFALLGLYDITTGTLLVDGIRITYPFPQKEFGVDVMRQMPLIELSRAASLVLFCVLLIDSVFRLYCNHGREQAMGLFGPINAMFKLVAAAVDRKGADAAIQAELDAKSLQIYKAKLVALQEDNQSRGSRAFEQFVRRARAT